MVENSFVQGFVQLGGGVTDRAYRNGMTALAIQLLRMHQGAPAKRFYASEQLQRQPGLAAIDAAYAELLERGLVEPKAPGLTTLKEPRPTYLLTPSGRDAVGITPA